jgi:adenylate cyclase class IV
MQINLYRAVKRYCRSIDEIEKALGELGAEYVDAIHQTDYVYRIFHPATGTPSKRIKARVNQDGQTVVHVYERAEREDRVSFEQFEFADSRIVDFINTLFDVSVIVRKKRRIWRKNRLVIHLDSVSGVGDIFEIESPPDPSADTLAEIAGIEKRAVSCWTPFPFPMKIWSRKDVNLIDTGFEGFKTVKINLRGGRGWDGYRETVPRISDF